MDPILSTIIAERFKALVPEIIKGLNAEIKQIVSNNILEYQVEEYQRNSLTKTLLHRVQPKKLLDFYQPLFIRNFNKRRPTPTTMPISTNSIVKLFANKQCITLIGNAGSGKSTIIKYLFLNCIDTEFKIPIKVELRYLNDYNSNIIDFIKEKILKINNISTSDKITERLLKTGNFMIFLDGYDEINSMKKEKITKEIDDLTRIYNKNFFLLTSRPYTEIDLLPLFHNYEVCELSDADINSFIKRQIPIEEKELCDKIIEAVNSQENISYKSFLSNPLLLSMFILTFQSYSSIPQKRNEFYGQVFDALYSVHDSMSKLAFVREKQSGLSKEQIVEVLKVFSFMSYFDEKFIFDVIYINKQFNLIKEKKKNILFENSKLINDLQVAIGIINKEGTDYTFPHRSLQEYFSALYIASLSEENKKIVYSKIISAMVDTNSFRPSSRDNFHLLLSELDERCVILFAIIPYLDAFIGNIDFDNMIVKEIIDTYVALNEIYGAFNSIIKSTETLKAHNNFNEKFGTYRQSRGDIPIAAIEDHDKHLEVCRKKLAENDIKPFLKSFVKQIKNKREELKTYLDNETQSDSDIISFM